jgi:hypothetical protein
MNLTQRIVEKATQLSKMSRFKRLEAEEYQHLELQRLLIKAKNTEFGQYYEFDKILQSKNLRKTYSEKVPLFTYENIFDKWWHKLLIPKPNVTWPGQIKYFALSSGTSAASTKHIPVSDLMTQSMRRAALKMFFSLRNHTLPNNLYTKDMLLIGSTSQLNEENGYFTGDLSGINAKRPPFWIRGYYKPGTQIAAIKDWEQRVQEICKQSHKWDVGFVSGVASWVQLTVEEVMKYHKIDDIHELWPNLKVFVNGGVALEPYKVSFQQLCSKPITFLDSYLASEGFIAFQNRPDTEAMALLLNNNIYFEFLPFNDDTFDENGEPRPGAMALGIEEVETGLDYALVISTCSGAWRYLIGDTIQFTNLEKSEIRISGRTKHFLSLCGEHLSVDNMNTALLRTQKKMGMAIKEFCVHGVEEDKYFSHQWYIGAEEDFDRERFGTILDQELRITNDDYAAERDGNLLKNIYVSWVEIDKFYHWLQAKSSCGGQNKFPRVLKGARIQEWKDFIEKG